MLVLVCATTCKIICIHINWQEETNYKLYVIKKQVALPATH